MIREFTYTQFMALPVIEQRNLYRVELNTPFLLEGKMGTQQMVMDSIGSDPAKFDEMIKTVRDTPQELHKLAGTPKVRNWISIDYWTIVCGKKTQTRHVKSHLGKFVPEPIRENGLIDTSFLDTDGILKITDIQS